jgi:hypothetical protein
MEVVTDRHGQHKEHLRKVANRGNCTVRRFVINNDLLILFALLVQRGWTYKWDRLLGTRYTNRILFHKAATWDIKIEMGA